MRQPVRPVPCLAFHSQKCRCRDSATALGWATLSLWVLPPRFPGPPANGSWLARGPPGSNMEPGRGHLSVLLTPKLRMIREQRVACWVPGLMSWAHFGIF